MKVIVTALLLGSTWNSCVAETTEEQVARVAADTEKSRQDAKQAEFAKLKSEAMAASAQNTPIASAQEPRVKEEEYRRSQISPEQAANKKLEAIIQELAAQNALLREAANRPVEQVPESPKAYVPPPQRPAVNIARAQTLARSSRNPEAQRMGRAMLQEAANQKRIADAVRSGSISSEEAGREWHRIDMENQLDEMQDHQERDLQRLNDEVSELRRAQENRNTSPTQPYNRR